MPTYTYSLSSDFGGSINIQQFHIELFSEFGINPLLIGITKTGDIINIRFLTSLNGGQQNTLDDLVTAHNATPPIFNSIQFITITHLNSPYVISRFGLYCDTSGGNIVVKLPKSNKSNGVYAVMRKTSASNSLTVDGTGNDKIDGLSTKVVTANNSDIILLCDGSGWNTVAGDSQVEIPPVSVTINKGDIAVDDGNTTQPLAVGTDSYVMMADSTTNLGVKWAQQSHTNLSNIGTNTHTQIDSHISATTAVHGVSGSVVGTTSTQTLINKTITSPSITTPTITTPTIQSNLLLTNSYIEIDDISAPSNPSAGKGRLYKKTGNDGIFWKPDAAGTEVDLTTIPKVIRQGHTWTIPSDITLPSGDTNFIMPFFVSLATGQTAKIVAARYVINSGTSATVKIQKNGSDVTGFTNTVVTTTATTMTPTSVTLATDDKLALVVTATSGSPKNLSYTLFLEHTLL